MRTSFIKVNFILIFTFNIINALNAQTAEIGRLNYMLELNQHGQAKALVKDLLVKSPGDPLIWYQQGRIFLEAKDTANALASFDKGIQLNDKEGLNYVGKARILLAKKKNTEAEAFFSKALELSKSKNTQVTSAVAEAYISCNYKLVDAIVMLEKVVSASPGDHYSLVLLGDAYLANADGGKAVTQYEHAVKANPQTALPHYKIGLLYKRSKNLEVAQEEFTKAIAVDPNYGPAYKELGELYYLKKDGVNAVKAYENYMRLSDESESAKIRYAVFLLMAKDFKKANDILAEEVKKPNVSAVTWRYYALALFESGNLTESDLAFQNYFLAAPEDKSIAGDYAYYAKLLLKLNRDSLALINLDKSLTLNNNQPEVLQLNGEIAFKTKKYELSIDAYKVLLATQKRLTPKDYFNFGRAAYFTKQYAMADSAFQQLLLLQPNMTVGYLWRGRANASLDPESEEGRALPYYEKVIEFGSVTPEKFKNDLIEAYSYVGYYQFVKQNTAASRASWEKVLKLDPDDARAKEALQALR